MEAAVILRLPKTRTASVLRPRAGAVSSWWSITSSAQCGVARPLATPHLQAGFLRAGT